VSIVSHIGIMVGVCNISAENRWLDFWASQTKDALIIA